MNKKRDKSSYLKYKNGKVKSHYNNKDEEVHDGDIVKKIKERDLESEDVKVFIKNNIKTICAFFLSLLLLIPIGIYLNGNIDKIKEYMFESNTRYEKSTEISSFFDSLLGRINLGEIKEKTTDTNSIILLINTSNTYNDYISSKYSQIKGMISLYVNDKESQLALQNTFTTISEEIDPMIDTLNKINLGNYNNYKDIYITRLEYIKKYITNNINASKPDLVSNINKTIDEENRLLKQSYNNNINLLQEKNIIYSEESKNQIILKIK